MRGCLHASYDERIMDAERQIEYMTSSVYCSFSAFSSGFGRGTVLGGCVFFLTDNDCDLMINDE